MTIRFRCTSCDKPLKVDDRFAGAKFKCPGCGETTRVPRTPKQLADAGPETSSTQTEKKLKKSTPAEQEEEIPPVRFGKGRKEDEGLDMTPMVDITFLLLIFFMVTAAFNLQKGFGIPTPEKDETAAQAMTIEQIENDNVIVKIDKDNTVWVNDSEALSEQDVLVKLREAKEGSGGGGRGLNSLYILADGDARHETVVMCLDAGNAVGMENVRLATVDEEDF